MDDEALELIELIDDCDKFEGDFFKLLKEGFGETTELHCCELKSFNA